MKQTKLHLSETDRKVLRTFRAKGHRSARELNRAHILAALDQQVAETQITQVLGVGRTTIWRTRAAYLEKGLDYALIELPRPGQPLHYQTDQQAEVVVLACRGPP